MDGISRLLRMARLEATLDKRCRLAGSTRMEVDPEGARDIPFHVLLEGECTLEVGGELYPMKAGDVAVIPSGGVHRILTAGTGAVHGTVERRGTSLAFTSSAEGGSPVMDLFCGHYNVGAGAGAILFGSLPTPTLASVFDSEDGRAALTRLAELMRSEAEHDTEGSAAIMSALCTVLIALVLRTSGTAGGRARLWTANPDDQLGGVIRRILAEPGEDWSIIALSRQLAMSRATFIRRFSAGTGMTYGVFLTRARLMTAADLLVSSDSTISTIAARVGYQSESAFSRAFRTAVGETPARFRRQQRQLSTDSS
ncbi:cupin domain-containing protein [Leifsonia shinshuensis]|uniref:AraC family transcriptional regulator n=1 Tax=Leifsonia shinshuensis TaxID=150026 RepID=A0A7G6Y9N9_9MICO|nr:AraC family transcriptional regulator [Leifsonia shinshuensis]QNE35204.1 AraC family transcriptional regulator [Leifsonia shinshuensis]